MLLDFFYELRRRKVPVSTTEWMTLMHALKLGLHDSSLDGFYRLSRAICVKSILAQIHEWMVSSRKLGS